MLITFAKKEHIMKNNKIMSLSVVIGAVLWCLAAWVVQQFGFSVFNGNDANMFMMLLSSVPSTLVFLWLIKLLVKKTYSQLFEPVVIITTTATLLDGIAMTYFREIFYHSQYLISLRGAAWILWGVGIALLLSYILVPKSEKLSVKKTSLAVILGIAFWLNGAIVINQMGDYILTDNNNLRSVGLLIAIPVTVITVIIAKYLLGLPYSKMVKPIVLMTLTATFCDTIALTWFQSLYSNSTDIAFHGAALILWGAGLGLLIAYYLEKVSIQNAK